MKNHEADRWYEVLERVFPWLSFLNIIVGQFSDFWTTNMLRPTIFWLNKVLLALDGTFCHPPWKTIVKKKSPVPNPPFLGIRLFSRKTNGWKLKKIHHWGPKADSELGKSHFFGGFCRWVFGTVSFPGNSLRKWRFWDVELTWSFDSQVVKVTLLMFGAKKLGHFAWITWVPKKTLRNMMNWHPVGRPLGPCKAPWLEGAYLQFNHGKFGPPFSIFHGKLQYLEKDMSPGNYSMVGWFRCISQWKIVVPFLGEYPHVS